MLPQARSPRSRWLFYHQWPETLNRPKQPGNQAQESDLSLGFPSIFPVVRILPVKNSKPSFRNSGSEKVLIALERMANNFVATSAAHDHQNTWAHMACMAVEVFSQSLLHWGLCLCQKATLQICQKPREAAPRKTGMWVLVKLEHLELLKFHESSERILVRPGFARSGLPFSKVLRPSEHLAVDLWFLSLEVVIKRCLKPFCTDLHATRGALLISVDQRSLTVAPRLATLDLLSSSSQTWAQPGMFATPSSLI